MNPLARSRLEAAALFLNTHHEDVSPTKEYIIIPYTMTLEMFETIRSALDHLLKPEVTDDMVDTAMRQGGCVYREGYKAMIAERTREDA
jgi:hypothetical protein